MNLINWRQKMSTRKIVKKLLDLLSYKRPAGSDTEMKMIRRYIDVLPNVQTDSYGNRIVRVGSDNTTMFSCHTDTVHKTEGMQKVYHDKHKQELFVQHGECLGADDGAGIIIMIMLIRSGVNGLYIFHREEEIGGRGSDYIQKETPEILEGIDRCIAFDRRGTQSIITHQGFERCCSDDFTEDFAQELMKDSDLWFFPDDTGSFTDSANYTHIIPECTNLSCGYEAEHTSAEILDVGYLRNLITALLKVNFDNLVTSRDPMVVEEYDFNDYGGFGKARNYEQYDDDIEYKYKPDIRGMTYPELLDYVYDNPEDTAVLLQEYRDYLNYEQDPEKYAG